jgi:septum formation protein
MGGGEGARLILASASPSRRALLVNAGVAAGFEAAPVDEAGVKEALRAEGAAAWQAAETLAELKARHVSRRHPRALVIGADQMLVCEGAWFDKPGGLEEAAAHLRRLSGKVHELETAVAVLRGGEVLWHHNERARLWMRRLSEDFITGYLKAVGDKALHSVGAYQLEGRGAQLFRRVEGDFFTILGLPLLPLLDFLRNQGMVPA